MITIDVTIERATKPVFPVGHNLVKTWFGRSFALKQVKKRHKTITLGYIAGNDSPYPERENSHLSDHPWSSIELVGLLNLEFSRAEGAYQWICCTSHESSALLCVLRGECFAPLY